MKNNKIIFTLYFCVSLLSLLFGFHYSHNFPFVIDNNVSAFVSNNFFYCLVFFFLILFSLFVTGVFVLFFLNITKNSKYVIVVFIISYILSLHLIFFGFGILLDSILFLFDVEYNNNIVAFRIPLLFGVNDIVCGFFYLVLARK